MPFQCYCGRILYGKPCPVCDAPQEPKVKKKKPVKQDNSKRLEAVRRTFSRMSYDPDRTK